MNRINKNKRSIETTEIVVVVVVAIVESVMEHPFVAVVAIFNAITIYRSTMPCHLHLSAYICANGKY
jgi:hypothetical protein